MNRPVLLLSTLFVSASTSASYAELIAYEGFDYADIRGILAGKDGGKGFDGEWEAIPNSVFPSNPLLCEIAEGSLNYGGMPTTGNRVRNTSYGFWPLLARTLADPVLPEDVRTMYVSFLVRPEGNTRDRIFGAGLLGGNGHSQELYLADGGSVFIGAADTHEYKAGEFRGDLDLPTGVFWEDRETTLMVVRAELNPGIDTLSVYINPTPGFPEPTTDAVTGNMEIDGLSALLLMSAGPHSIDELRWGESFADVVPTVPMLRAGDADQDLDFDQFDLVQIQVAAKYLMGQPATWGEGDWNGAPGGSQGNPPTGDGLFNQLDIIAALYAGKYLTGPYAAIPPGGQIGDAQTSIVDDAGSGEVSVDAPAGKNLTSINTDSASDIFTGDAAHDLGGSLDNDSDNHVFKATFGDSFGSLSFGNVAQSELSEAFVLADLTVVGSLAGGGDLGDVDLVYIPEPTTFVLLGVAMATVAMIRRPRRTLFT